MKVLRMVHSKYNVGPYEARKNIGNWEDYHMKKIVNNPPPNKDGIDDFSPYYVFGFDSALAFYLWFEGTFLYFRELGFVVKCFEVDENYICFGKNQLCFDPKYAKLLWTY